MAYATTTDLEEYLDPLPVDAELMLARASRLVGQAVRNAVYHTDTDGVPTDESVVTALMEATCEQVVAWVRGGGDGTGVGEQFTSVSIGSVSLSRAGGGTAGGQSAADTLCLQSRLILDEAGLLRAPLWSW